MWSPVLSCSCIDGLLVELSNAVVGCFIGNYFVGALGYADDIVLLNMPMIIVPILMPGNQNV